MRFGCFFHIIISVFCFYFSDQKALAKSDNTCIKKVLDQLVNSPLDPYPRSIIPEKFTKMYVDDELKKKVTDYMLSSNTSKNTEIHFYKIFNLYVDSRLKDLPLETQEQARRVLLNRQELGKSATKRGSLTPYTTKDPEIRMYFADEEFFQLDYFSVLAHELEHFIQFSKPFKRKEASDWLNIILMGSSKMVDHTRTEYGAMKASYDFLQSMTPEVRSLILKDLDKLENKEMYNTAKALFDSSIDDFSVFLKVQGRVTQAQLMLR
jgi:hypothetical protein